MVGSHELLSNVLDASLLKVDAGRARYASWAEGNAHVAHLVLQFSQIF